jgi:hypothetical protein
MQTNLEKGTARPRRAVQDLEARLAALDAMDKPELVKAWRAAWRCEPPPRVRADFLRRAVAHAWQIEALGYDPDLRRRLSVLIKGEQASARVAVGARLVREWNNITHSVGVVAEGYEYGGRRWKSLSAIAREITGTRWSGPLFFGLKGRASSDGGERP